MEKRLIFISGGARSGKTSFAEAYAVELANIQKSSLYYLATSQKDDQEMIKRVERHQEDREKSIVNWQTIEQSVDISEVVTQVNEQSVILLDCITLLLSNELFKGDFDEEQFIKNSYQEYVKTKIVSDVKVLAEQVNTLLVVSNEVLFEPLDPANKVVWVYQKLLGEIHQELVAHSDEAYLIQAGMKIRKK